MLTFNESLKDNTVSINGHVIGKVTDEEAKYIISLIQGTVTPTTTPNVKKPSYDYHDTKTQYSIEKIESLYIIKTGIFYRARVARAVANSYIKALDGIIEIELPRANGNGKYKAWGFKTKKAAESALATLPQVLTADELKKHQSK